MAIGMDRETQVRLAALVRAAAAQAVSEGDFWTQFKALVNPFADPFAGIAYEIATHYWGDFHARNILFIPVKPNADQVMQGKDALNLVAEALEQDWPPAELRQRLDDI